MSKLFCKHIYETIRVTPKVKAEEGYQLTKRYYHDIMCTKCYKVKKNVDRNKAELIEIVNKRKNTSN